MYLFIYVHSDTKKSDSVLVFTPRDGTPTLIKHAGWVKPTYIIILISSP